MDVVSLSLANVAARNNVRTLRPSGNRVVCIGDSITSNNDGGHFKQLCQRTNQAARYAGYYAAAGKTLAQIQDDYLPTVLALSGNQRPAACVILGGTNDVGANSGDDYDHDASTATYGEIVDALKAAGILPVMATIPPRGDDTSSNVNAQLFNAWVKQYAALNGIPVLDYHAALVSTGGVWASGTSGDNVHPNGVGFRTMTAAVYEDFAALFGPNPPWESKSTIDSTNLLSATQRLFMGAESGNVAGGWANYSTGSGQVFDVIDNDATITGYWQSLRKPLAATGNAYLQTSGTDITTGFSVGDRLAFTAKFQALNFETQLGGQSATCLVSFRTVANAIISSMQPLYSSISDFSDTATMYAEGVVPATCTRISVSFQVDGTAVDATGATLKVAQPMLTNLTTIGLD